MISTLRNIATKPGWLGWPLVQTLNCAAKSRGNWRRPRLPGLRRVRRWRWLRLDGSSDAIAVLARSTPNQAGGYNNPAHAVRSARSGLSRPNAQLFESKPPGVFALLEIGINRTRCFPGKLVCGRLFSWRSGQDQCQRQNRSIHSSFSTSLWVHEPRPDAFVYWAWMRPATPVILAETWMPEQVRHDDQMGSNSTVKFIAKILSSRNLPSGPAARRRPGRLSTALQIAGIICWFMYKPKHWCMPQPKFI